MVHRRAKKKFTLELISKPQQVSKVESFLRNVTKPLRVNEDHFNRLLIATTEAVNNSILHGNKRDPKKKVILICEVGSTVLVIRVQDEGPGIDPSTLPDPLAEENLLRENGRGVFLMRSLMKNVKFKKLRTGSEVSMRMKL